MHSPRCLLTGDKFVNARLRYLSRDLYDHLNDESVDVTLALQLIQDDRENGLCTWE